jgi:SAM-dependent methyltransferase
MPEMPLTDLSRRVKDRPLFVSMMSVVCKEITDRHGLSLLILGGSDEDAHSLRQLGFSNTTLSNLSSPLDGAPGAALHDNGQRVITVDAEDISLLPNSYDIVFAHEVLHHCRSPHRALCEMLRVARRYVVFMEPNDSFAMRCLVRMGLSFPYELPAVIDHGGTSGGLRNSAVPNFIYRWNSYEVHKLVDSYLAEYTTLIHTRPYWDFTAVDEEELALRTQTRLAVITNLITPRGFLAMLKFGQWMLNRLRIFRSQGNKFLCLVQKSSELKPWLRSNQRDIVFSFEYTKKARSNARTLTRERLRGR